MRTFIGYVTSTFFWLLVIAGIGALVGISAREFFWRTGYSEFRKNVRDMANNARVDGCDSVAGLVEGVELGAYRQVRFLNDREYVVELVCEGFEDEPIQAKQFTLGKFLTKTPGTAGIINNRAVVASAVELQLFSKELAAVPNSFLPWVNWLHRKGTIGITRGEMYEAQELREDVSHPVAAACEGYGYTCCDPATQAGVGEGIAGLPSCPATCFAQCVSRPLIVSFRAFPLLEIDTRELIVSAGTEVEFNYVVSDDPAAAPWQAVVDLGDGQQQSTAGETGSLLHVYECAQSECRYTANLAVTNGRGVTSAPLPVSTIDVVVRSVENADFGF